MKIINNTDTDLVVTGQSSINSAINSKKVFAGTFVHIDQKLDVIVISCCYGHIDVVKTQDIVNLSLYPHENLLAKYDFDFESNDYVVTVFRVEEDDRCSNKWFEQQDKTLHDKSIRESSIHLTSAHITAFRRIDELTDAIKKSIQKCVPDQTTSDVKQIRNWAKEIMFQCNIIDSIDED